VPASRASLKKRWNESELTHERAQAELVRILELLIADLSESYKVRPVPFVTGRVKDFESFYDKAMRYQEDGRASSTEECFSEIKDVVRARVICQTLGDATHIRRMIENERTSLLVIDVQTHDGSERGYRGLHIESSVDALVRGAKVASACEIQVQTALQFAWNLYTHKDIYKGANVPTLVGNLMIELSDFLNVGDHIAEMLLKEIEASNG
jgi:ppGpp synthetase/RelA/SpoT-type nucleotidyltranferase